MNPAPGYTDNAERPHLQLLKELRGLRNDYKASVVAAEILGQDFPADAFFFRYQSTFRRQVSTDIEHVYWSQVDEYPDQLVFELNRDGIYDMLPEAITHIQGSGGPKTESETKRGNELRREEKAARNFFSPIENEFAHRSLKLDTVEREILRNDNPARTRQFFEYFYGSANILTDQQVQVLVYLLPLSHKIRGNTDLMSLTMSRILGYTVDVTRALRLKTFHPSGAPPPRLGKSTLGADSVLNDNFSLPVIHYDVHIRDIATSRYPDFSEGGRAANVLHFIMPYFFPAGADYHLHYLCPDTEETLICSTGETVSYLGFNSHI